jgi:hypothetical protein
LTGRWCTGEGRAHALRRLVAVLSLLLAAAAAGAGPAVALTDAELALAFRPLVRFDNSEDWRPLNLDRFFAERDPSTGAAYHRICDGGACSPITSVAGLALHHTSSSTLDIHGSGSEANCGAAAEAAPLAQLMGTPLRPGERLAVAARRALRTTLAVRVATRRYSGVAYFGDVALHPGTRARVAVTSDAGRPAARLVVDGRTLRPTSLRLARLRS